jgi:hypothetical protein
MAKYKIPSFFSFNIRAATPKSSVRPPVQLPM